MGAHTSINQECFSDIILGMRGRVANKAGIECAKTGCQALMSWHSSQWDQLLGENVKKKKSYEVKPNEPLSNAYRFPEEKEARKPGPAYMWSPSTRLSDTTS